LGVGFALAWPLRRATAPPPKPLPAPQAATVAPAVLETPIAAALQVEAPPLAAGAPVRASMTGLVTGGETSPLAVQLPPAAEPAPTTPTDESAGLLESSRRDAAAEPQRHVVHNGDTLGTLAERYLGDESRALEIFDLNRDVLNNPHLLPIGAELRIPTDGKYEAEPAD
jgi:nucleoid-associated protein YgaU